MTNATLILVGLGANLPSAAGQPGETLTAAIDLIATEGVRITQVSSFYETTALPPSGQPNFVNGVFAAETSLTAKDVLKLFQSIETKFGRKPGERWSARTLDIDLLSYGETILPNFGVWEEICNSKDPAAILEEPIVPHPRLHKRAFVMIPLLEVAPNWFHPCLKMTAGKLAESLVIRAQADSVRKLSTCL